MRRMMCAYVAAFIAVLTFTAGAFAQTSTPTRLRGTIVALDGQVLTIATREGPQAKVTLDEKFVVSAPHRLTIADIKPNSYIGTAAVPAADGTLTALEVVVIPEASRGSGDGHYGWDLSPGSTMTNANVDAIVESAAGRTLTLTYKTGSIKVTVPENVPIVAFGPAERSDLKPGAKVFIGANKAPDGSFTASRVLVEKEGVVPPI